LKRFFAIVLLSVHLFYLGGYSLLFQYYIHQSDVQIVKQMFNNKTKFIEIKLPVHLPTIQDWSEYEEIVGQIQLKDAYYNYVRLKMTRDTMYLICIPNTAKTRLVNANVITATERIDVPLSKKGDLSVKKVNALSEYNLQAFQYNYSAFGIFLKHAVKPVSLRLNNPFIESPGKPPNFIS